MLKYYLFRFAGLLAPHIPARIGYALCAFVGNVWFLFGAHKQPTYLFNVRTILGDGATDDQVHSVARRGFQNLIKNYFDLFRNHGLTRETIQRQLFRVDGLAYLENAIKQGKGVIAGSGHFGAWDMVIQLTAVYLNVKVVVPNERFGPEKLFQYVLGLRKSQGIEMAPLDVAPRALIKVLKEGGIAGLAYDRDITKTGPIVQFFGKPTQMPDGAVQLALKFGVPVIIGFSIRQADNRSLVILEPPLVFERTGDARGDIQAGTQRLAAVMERYIRHYPDQWLMFQKIW
ncbi:MAG: hypothetical protein HY868_24810 [Chloroflexi bacterium]|nr:hypothetical protein [Chloroflexota bacterium]